MAELDKVGFGRSDRETLLTYLEKLPPNVRKDILRDRRGYPDERGGEVFRGVQTWEEVHIVCRELEAVNQSCRGIDRTYSTTESRTEGSRQGVCTSCCTRASA